MSGQGNGLGGCRDGCIGTVGAAIAVVLVLASLLFVAMDSMPPAPTGAQTQEAP